MFCPLPYNDTCRSVDCPLWHERTGRCLLQLALLKYVGIEWPKDNLEINSHLSQRERQILHYLAKGDGNKQIAEALRLSTKTVRNHISHILVKLGARNRTDAARIIPFNGWKINLQYLLSFSPKNVGKEL